MGRYALLIGCNKYVDEKLLPLVKPEADVRALADILENDSIGAFDQVTIITNPKWYEAQPAITKFFKDRNNDDFLLMYFAGHGIRNTDGQLFLGFIDTSYDDLEGTAILDSFVARQMDRARAECQLLILDCCHSGAFAREARSGLGNPAGLRDAYDVLLSGVHSIGRMILTATDAIQYAWEGDNVLGSVPNSVFTHFLVSGLRSGDADIKKDGVITVDEVYEYLYRSIRQVTPNQEPQLLTRSGDHWGDIVVAFNPNYINHKADTFNLVKLQNRLFPNELSENTGVLEETERLIKKGELVSEDALKLLYHAASEDGDVDVRYRMISALEAASTYLGQKLRLAVLDVLPAPFAWCEIPNGSVSLFDHPSAMEVQPYLMATYPITYAQFEVFVNSDDGYNNNEWWEGLSVRHAEPGRQPLPIDNHPRVNVSWYDAIAFCRWLTSKLDCEIRLPTEWEWQWAAQGVQGYLYPWGNEFYKAKCNIYASGLGRTTPVNHFEGASSFGVYDMCGNVWERCLNLYSPVEDTAMNDDKMRGLRGGSWRYPEKFCRNTFRHKCVPFKRFNDGGFRITARPSWVQFTHIHVLGS